MTKKIVKKKTINKSINNISQRKLSIQFSLDGFSFCISNHEDEIYHFSSFDFENTLNSPQELLNQIETIFKSEMSLQDDFASVVVIHQNNLNTFVPSELFLEKELKHYLQFSVKTIQTDLVVYDSIDSLNLKNVYIPYVNVNNYLFQNFGEFEFKHHSTQLVEKLAKYATGEEVQLFVNVCKHSFDLVGFNGPQFSFYNTFDYQSKEDFIYYLLFSIEQLKLHPETVSVYFIGEINKESEAYKIAYQYIRNVQFLDVKNAFFNDQTEVANHSNFILVG